MTKEVRDSIEKEINDLSHKGLRVLAFAEIPEGGALKNMAADHKDLKDIENYDKYEQGATFIGFVCIKDPARPEVKSAISACTTAGIRVIMITGDAI